MPIGRRSVYADLALSRFSEDSEETLVVVEVKCFNNPEQDLTQLYESIGQYLIYQHVLRRERVSVPLYLSLPADAYERLMRIYDITDIFEYSQINLVIIDLEVVEVVEWITWTPF